MTHYLAKIQEIKYYEFVSQAALLEKGNNEDKPKIIEHEDAKKYLKLLDDRIIPKKANLESLDKEIRILHASIEILMAKVVPNV